VHLVSTQLYYQLVIYLITDPHKNGSESEVRAIEGIENLGYSSEDGDEDVRSDDEEEDDSEEEGEECEEEESEEDEESDEEEPSTNSETVRRMKKTLSGKEGERMAAASLCVNVGSFSDPPDLPGLAHFLEHMVFMGSDKYPQENALDEFVKV
jgi:nardilysin